MAYYQAQDRAGRSFEYERPLGTYDEPLSSRRKCRGPLVLLLLAVATLVVVSTMKPSTPVATVSFHDMGSSGDPQAAVSPEKEQGLEDIEDNEDADDADTDDADNDGTDGTDGTDGDDDGTQQTNTDDSEDYSDFLKCFKVNCNSELSVVQQASPAGSDLLQCLSSASDGVTATTCWPPESDDGERDAKQAVRTCGVCNGCIPGNVDPNGCNSYPGQPQPINAPSEEAEPSRVPNTNTSSSKHEAAQPWVPWMSGGRQNATDAPESATPVMAFETTELMARKKKSHSKKDHPKPHPTHKKAAAHEKKAAVHDKKAAAHDKDATVHDKRAATHEKKANVHDKSAAAHEKKATVRDKHAAAHEKKANVHDKSATAHEKKATVHDKSAAAHEKTATVHDKRAAAHEKTAAAHEKRAAVHDKTAHKAVRKLLKTLAPTNEPLWAKYLPGSGEGSPIWAKYVSGEPAPPTPIVAILPPNPKSKKHSHKKDVVEPVVILPPATPPPTNMWDKYMSGGGYSGATGASGGQYGATGATGSQYGGAPTPSLLTSKKHSKKTEAMAVAPSGNPWDKYMSGQFGSATTGSTGATVLADSDYDALEEATQSLLDTKHTIKSAPPTNMWDQYSGGKSGQPGGQPGGGRPATGGKTPWGYGSSGSPGSPGAPGGSAPVSTYDNEMLTGMVAARTSAHSMSHENDKLPPDSKTKHRSTDPDHDTKESKETTELNKCYQTACNAEVGQVGSSKQGRATLGCLSAATTQKQATQCLGPEDTLNPTNNLRTCMICHKCITGSLKDPSQCNNPTWQDRGFWWG